MTPRHIDIAKPSESACRTTRQILERIGDKWTLYVVGTLRQGPLRFNEIRRAVDGVSQRMLTLTLRGLERDGLVTRTMFPSIPPRVEYELTELGQTLIEPVAALVGWVGRNQAAIEDARARFDGGKVAKGEDGGFGFRVDGPQEPAAEQVAEDELEVSVTS